MQEGKEKVNGEERENHVVNDLFYVFWFYIPRILLQRPYPELTVDLL